MSKYYTRPSNLELCHYGVKGMKWGVRHDYEPIGRRRFGRQIQAGPKQTQAGPTQRSAKGGTSQQKSTKEQSQNQEQPKQKKKLTTGQKLAIAGATAVAAYAAYKFVDSGAARQAITKGQAFITGKKTGFKTNTNLSKKMDAKSIKESVVDAVNPDYGKFGTKMNCRRCTMAYEMRRRGFDVAATRSNSATGQSFVGLYNATNKSNQIKGGRIGGLIDLFKTNSAVSDYMDKQINLKKDESSDPVSYGKKIFEALSKNPNGARGELELRWVFGGGHSIAWEIIDNKPVIFDCQTKEMFDSVDKFVKYSKNAVAATSTRLDNLDLNEDMLTRWLRNA